MLGIRSRKQPLHDGGEGVKRYLRRLVWQLPDLAIICAQSLEETLAVVRAAQAPPCSALAPPPLNFDDDTALDSFIGKRPPLFAIQQGPEHTVRLRKSLL